MSVRGDEVGGTPLRVAFAGDPAFQEPKRVDRAAAAVRRPADKPRTTIVERPSQGSNMNVPTNEMAKWTDK